MMIIMKANATPQQVENVINQIKSEGLAVHLSQGVETTIIGAIGETHRTELADAELVAHVAGSTAIGLVHVDARVGGLAAVAATTGGENDREQPTAHEPSSLFLGVDRNRHPMTGR